ncbi:MAG: tubulin-like doman-containing protein [Pirellulales bacterium]
MVERIGSGGYGEVWRVEAPGGLNKAMKIVFGRMDDARAERELKALNRIKQVRHPFLLSLERIEVVDGRLVIVSELADRSLKDRYDECRGNGAPGIPRDELVAYLREAADALDHLANVHGLQHLDVKPENLLLTGHHIKVADFGLVKDITEVSMSMMGGLTPTYAPPEVFDDRASTTSDQYSLAIVYQEMLTGIVPFPGRTAAQLAAQHLKSEPRLTPLPPADRGVIARCLAKSPDQRYGSCSEFVDELIDAGDRGDEYEHDDRQRCSSVVATSVIERARAPLPFGDTDDEPLDDVALELDLPPVERPKAAYEAAGLPDRIVRRTTVRDMPPLELPDAQAPVRPVILIGIGGTGGQILERMRRQLNRRFGNARRIPAIQLLLIDTDQSAINQLTLRGDGTGLSARESMLLRLRKAHDYRHYSAALLRWLSRRWLYNIPRSLTTEGIRPLGRLALVDHAKEFTTRLSAMVDLAHQEDSVRETSYSLNLEVDRSVPNVFVVGSATGGTASGMMLDVGYAVREVLEQHSLPCDGLHGMMLHFTARGAKDVTLQLANSHALLTEAYHYQQLGAGGIDDNEAVFAGGSTDKPPFEQTYFVHLGDDLEDHDISQGIDHVVDYLLASTVTPAATVLAQARRMAEHPGNDSKSDSRLRSFGVKSLRLNIAQDASEDIDVICAHVLEQWSDPRLRKSNTTLNARSHSTVNLSKAVEENVSPTMARCQQAQASFGISVAELTEQLREAIAHELGGELDARVDELADMPFRVAGVTVTLPADSIDVQQQVQLINAAFEPVSRDDRDNEDTPSRFRRALASGSESLAGTFDQLVGWIRRLADEPDARLPVAHEAAEWFEATLANVRDDAEQRLHEAQQDLVKLRQAAAQSFEASRKKRGGMWRAVGRALHRRRRARFLRDYAQLQLQVAILTSVARHVERCRVQTESIPLTLEKMQRAIDATMDQLPAPKAYSVADVEAKSPLADEGNCIRSLRMALSRDFEAIVRRSEELVDQEFVTKSGGLEAALLGDHERAGDLLNQLRAAAIEALNRLCDSIGPVQLLVTSEEASETAVERWGASLQKSQAMAVDLGGTRQTVILAPRSLDAVTARDLTARAGGPEPTVVANPVREISFCSETSNLSLTQVAEHLIRRRPDVRDVSRRLRTRIDVEWAPLPTVEIEA